MPVKTACFLIFGNDERWPELADIYFGLRPYAVRMANDNFASFTLFYK